MQHAQSRAHSRRWIGRGGLTALAGLITFTVGCPAACDYIVQAAVRPPDGAWGAPVTLTTDLYFGGGGIVLGMDGAGNAIAAWGGNYADESHYAVLPAGGS